MRKTKRKITHKSKKKLKKTSYKRNLTERKKTNRKRTSFKNKSLKQKGGNLGIILPVVGVVLVGATIGDVYMSNKTSNKMSNKMSNKNINNNTSINPSVNQNNLNMLKLKEDGVWINEHVIVNIMLDKIQKMYEEKKGISIEEILLEPEQTVEKKYEKLYDVAEPKKRTVSGYVDSYISRFLLAYFLYHLGEKDDYKLSDVFPDELKQKFNNELKTIKKTNLSAEKEIIQMPDNIESIFDDAKTEINMINSFIKKYPMNEGYINIEEFVKNIEKKYIEQYAPMLRTQDINDEYLLGLKSPKIFYTKIINKYKNSSDT